MKLKIKKGDIVKIMTGENKGAQGKVLEVMPADCKALVEGCNLVSKSTKPNAKTRTVALLRKKPLSTFPTSWLLTLKETLPASVEE